MSTSGIPNHSIKPLSTPSTAPMQTHSTQRRTPTAEEKELIEEILAEHAENFAPEKTIEIAMSLKGRLEEHSKKQQSMGKSSFLGRVFTGIKTLITGNPAMSFIELAEKVSAFASPTFASQKPSIDSKKVQNVARSIINKIAPLVHQEASSLEGKITPPPSSAINVSNMTSRKAPADDSLDL